MRFSQRRGFTLLELLVVVVLAGVVALLVYGAAGAAADVQERLQAERNTMQSVRAMRTTIEDALRNALPAGSNADTVFRLEDHVGASGYPADRVSFIAAGTLPPLTPDADWAVTIEPSAEGLSLVAVPLGFAEASRVIARLPGVTGLDARVLAGTGRQWVNNWNDVTKLPRAVELQFWADTGALGAPIRLIVPAGGAGGGGRTGQ